jgi:rare lipoprotein A (peptidoglycan hydrolase)
MVVSMLLAGPAFAGTQAVTDTPAHSRKATHPVVVQKKSGRTTAAARDPKPGRADQARVTFVEDTSVWNDSPAGGRSPVRGAQAYANQSPFGTQVPYAAQTRGGGAWKQTGTASWYGGARWAGHMTASGARYNENELTAARQLGIMGQGVATVTLTPL